MGEGKVIQFPLDDPPTLPHRTTSGHQIKPQVIRALQEQGNAERKCHDALDALIQLVRSIELDQVPSRLRDSLRPALVMGVGMRVGK
jgi:hypothetical protein